MEYWIGRDGERHGPYKEEDVRQWLRSGQVSGSDLAWREGMADWQPLSVLFPDVKPDPAVPPPSTASALPQTTAAALEDYAGFWKRFGAWVIDFLVLLIPFTIIYEKMGVTDALKQYLDQLHGGFASPAAAEAAGVMLKHAMLVPGIITMLIGFAYYILLESSKLQATLGKLAIGIRVTDMNGQALSFAQCVVRNVVRLLNAIQIPFVGLIPAICYLATAWTARKQGWHDMVAKALVLNGRASEFKDAPVKPTASGGSFNA